MLKVLLCFFILNELTTQAAANGRDTLREGLFNDMVFPDSKEDETEKVTLIPKCHNQTFCEDVDHYPENMFYDILQSRTYRARYFQYFKNLNKTVDIFKSRTDETNGYFICPSKKTIVYPKAALNIENQLKFIYNVKRYKQPVLIEVCVKKEKCKFYEKVSNYRTKCQQKYVEKLLLSADTNGRPYIDRFKFPSACACSYEHAGTRFSQMYKY